MVSTAWTRSSSGLRSKRVMNRAARIMRSGSSENDSCGDSGVRSTWAARSAVPPKGSTSVAVSSGPVGIDSAMAFTVKSRRDRSDSISVLNVTSGLRESGS